MDNEILIRADDLSKKYKGKTVLRNIDLKLRKEGIYGLLGRNGSGKTTLLDLLTERIYPDGGEVRSGGSCCYMAERDFFPQHMKVRDIISYAAGVYPGYDGDYSDRLIERFKLDVNKGYKTLSRGYQSILKIVIGLSSQAEFTLFDEPVLGLDASARDIFYEELVEDFMKNPRLIVFSTHLIEETAELFNDVILLKKGRIVFSGNVEDYLSHAFYVTGREQTLRTLVPAEKILWSNNINNLAVAVVKGDMSELIGSRELTCSSITAQKLFIHLTEDSAEETGNE